MEIIKLTLGYYKTNCYIAIKDGKCLIIDPSFNPDLILEIIEERNLEPLAILCTHGHSDHIMAIGGVIEKYKNLNIYCHRDEITDEKYTIEFSQKIPTLASFENLVFLEDDSTLDIGNFQINVMHTPGHTPGSVIFIIEDTIFSGDTIFKLSIGRTDFEGGDEKAMFNSLRKISSLPKEFDNYDLLSGHGEDSTLSFEKKNNPYLRIFTKGY